MLPIRMDMILPLTYQMFRHDSLLFTNTLTANIHLSYCVDDVISVFIIRGGLALDGS